MGYGGFFKSVVRIAIPIAVSFIPGAGPIAVAISSAAATGLTGGSFKEALIAGASSLAASAVTSSLQSAAQNVRGLQASRNLAIAGVDDLGGTVAAQTLPSRFDAFTGKLVNQANRGISSFQDFALPDALSFGGFEEAGVNINKTAFDVLGQQGGETLQSLGLITGEAAPGIAERIVGGISGLTLEQALLAEVTPEIDQALSDIGLTPQAVQLLRQEARNKLSQEQFDVISGSGVVNPFAADLEGGQEEFEQVIARGIERRNEQLGPDITRAQFAAGFGDDPLQTGRQILGEERDIRRGGFQQEVESAFPGGLFQDVDADIISSIVEERKQPAAGQVATAVARGNLNILGGQTGQQFLSGQEPEAERRVREIGQGVLGQGRSEIRDIRERASQEAQGFSLGDPSFDVAPFSQERADVVSGRGETLRGDIIGALGTEPLFDAPRALSAAGSAQGPVSGAAQGRTNALLDVIAERERGLGRGRRGLTSGTSGVF